MAKGDMSKEAREEKEQEEEQEKLCPRCGQPYNYLNYINKNGKIYVYAVHVLQRKGNQKKVKQCYLGPKDSYTYVSRLHEKEGLEFKSITEPKRALEYLVRLVDFINEHGSKEDKREAKALLKTIKVRG